MKTATITFQNSKFSIGDRVRKKSGARWQGKIVGLYITNLTAQGYCVESETEIGSVQIYPEQALEPATQACRLNTKGVPCAILDEFEHRYKIKAETGWVGWIEKTVFERWPEER